MPVISKIRFTNVVYEGGAKRYNDATFSFDGHNSAIVLENGGGKTVFIQTAIQAVLPHSDLAGRRLKDTLSLENGPAHVAIEWLLAEKPRRRYAMTCVSLFMSTTGLDSYRYVYEYSEHDEHRLGKLPFTKEMGDGKVRVSEKGEIHEYYQMMHQKNALVAKTFDTLTSFHQYIEEHFHIIQSEWQAIVKINSSEGGIEAFFDECKTSSQLVDRLLIPTIEDAMEGFEQGTFADLFQLQREGFKQYKELKEKIEENKRILAELNKYVTGYAKLHNEQVQYEDHREKAKIYLEVAKQVELEQQAEQSRLLTQMEKWKEKFRNWQKREASLLIAEEQQKAGALETVLQEVEETKERLEKQESSAESYYYSLKYAEHREKLHESQEQMTFLQQEITRLEQSQDEEQLQAAWEFVGRKLKAYFDSEEQRYSKLLQEVEAELIILSEQHKELLQARSAANKDREAHQLEISKNETEQKMLQDQQQEIAQQILSQIASETVEQQMPVWIAEQQEQEQKGLERAKVLQELKQRKDQLSLENKQLSDNLLKLKREQTGLQVWQNRYERSHDEVKGTLAGVQSSWERIHSLHERKDTILDKLIDGLERRNRQKEQLLHKERIAFRYVDDYKDQEQFFADPEVVQLIQQWSNQFTLLETGVQYVEAVEGNHDHEHLWAVSLVTTAQEKPQLERKLADMAEQLQFPIRILSTQEARELVQLDSIGEENTMASHCWVEPAHWQSLHDSDHFNEWKQELVLEAEAAVKRRVEKEEELALWKDAQKQVDSFFGEYSLDFIHEQEQIITSLREQINLLEQRSMQVEQELGHLERDKDEISEAKHLAEQRLQYLSYLLTQGNQYMQLGKRIAALTDQLISIKEKHSRVGRLIEITDQRIANLEREKQQKEENKGDLKGKLISLSAQELYDKVKDNLPYPSEESYIVLREEYRELELKRHHILKNRSDLEKELGNQRKWLDEAKREMERLLNEHSNVDRELELPLQVGPKLDAAWNELQMLKDKSQRARNEWNRKDRELVEQEGAIRKQIEQYEKEFQNERPELFLESLVHVRKLQAAEQLQQEEIRKELNRLITIAAQRLVETQDVLQLWARHVLVHKLDDPLLEWSSDNSDLIQEITYQLKSGSQHVIDRLVQQQNAIKKEQERVDLNRRRFREFCQSQIQDIKLRQMAERGVEAKANYAELQEFESMMSISILKANQIAELRMQNEDKKLQQFISHIQAHLKLIAQELRELPKRTRVRTESGNKDIYTFQVPDWDEQEGKERIQHYMEWIIGQLEHGKYRDVDGNEQSSLIRRDLDKWLDAKQLLQKVFQQGAAIRVSCRKVNNDQQVTGASYSWEESNRWSGGEKWSKNMTLFLGILNYVAEKRQHIHSQMKRHRAVILDNPFGKASSDHVLSPVFYIAEQLGFQMIALTAHVEGKFLQDYFPVVYSCRLRVASGGGGKQIVDPKQQVQQAYFRDHAPESLDKIGGELKQMELFS